MRWLRNLWGVVVQALAGWLAHRLSESILLRELQLKRPESVLTIHWRPKYPTRMGMHKTYKPVPSADRIAIVVQGPVITEDDFTLESLCAYRAYWPNTEVILSTWEGLDHGLRHRIESSGITVVTSPRPLFPGYCNVNLQLTSSRAGIDASHGDFILKLRTDQRLCSDLALESLLSHASVFGQQRLVVVSLNTMKYRLFSVSDMLQFGTRDNMRTLWSCPPSTYEGVRNDSRNTKLGDHSLLEIPEVYLMRHYLEARGIPYEWTQGSYKSILRDHFVVLNAEQLDLFWPKYEAHLEYRGRNYGGPKYNEWFTAQDWLIAYSQVADSLDLIESVRQSRTMADSVEAQDWER